MYDHTESSFYQTGRTQPPKKRGGLLALVLVAFIFLSGIVSMLGLLNIRLFRKAEVASQETPLTFSRSAEAAQTTAYTDSFHISGLGISGSFTDSLDQLLYRLPQGFYVSSVEKGSHAEAKGILPGDIIQSFDGTAFAEADDLQTLLSSFARQQSVRLVIYRSGYLFLLDILPE